MPRLRHFIPALHQALVKARAAPPQELSASVEQQAREYLRGLREGKVGRVRVRDPSPKGPLSCCCWPDGPASSGGL